MGHRFKNVLSVIRKLWKDSVKKCCVSCCYIACYVATQSQHVSRRLHRL